MDYEDVYGADGVTSLTCLIREFTIYDATHTMRRFRNRLNKFVMRDEKSLNNSWSQGYFARSCQAKSETSKLIKHYHVFQAT